MTQTSHQWIVGHTFAASFVWMSCHFSWGIFILGYFVFSQNWSSWNVLWQKLKGKICVIIFQCHIRWSSWHGQGELVSFLGWVGLRLCQWLIGFNEPSISFRWACLQSKPSVTSRLYLFQGNQSFYLLKHVSNNRTGFHATSCKFSEVSC